MKKNTPLLSRRRSGILMPIFSLPSPHGIGTFGKAAYDFVDFLEKAKQSYWQILPLGPTGYGDSPYQAYSTFAGNPYFIDPEMLCEAGYLTVAECVGEDFSANVEKIDYGKLYHSRFPLLHRALPRFMANKPADFDSFCKKNGFWLKDYALYMALKNENGGKPFMEWAMPLRLRKRAALKEAEARLENEINFWKMVQYLFFTQWGKLKAYANKKGISIIGDLPIYVSPDSSDVWAAPEQFELDEERKLIRVAGCPPDAFTADGQLWGNPLYRWDVMKEDGFSWWCRRMKAVANLYDVVRLDHFRGFAGYYTIDAGRKNARRGKWEKGPGMDLFSAMKAKLGEIDIIAEDLGFLTPDVYQLLADSGYPGMKVLQFAFGDPKNESEYLPHVYPKNCVAYVGTHDNETVVGWMKTANAVTKKQATAYLRLNEKEGVNWGAMRAVLASPANTVILQMQDLLGLGNEARINEPSTLGKNWAWRVKKECINDWLAELIAADTATYFRAK